MAWTVTGTNGVKFPQPGACRCLGYDGCVGMHCALGAFRFHHVHDDSPQPFGGYCVYPEIKTAMDSEDKDKKDGKRNLLKLT